jgi:hypothetical protein
MIKNVIVTDNYQHYDVECDICRAGPLHDHGEVVSSTPKEGCGEYWRHRYEVCLDCLKAGPASFPDRLREYAQALEENAPVRDADC